MPPIVIPAKDANGNTFSMVVNPAYDAQDDMIKMKSIQKKWRDSFTTSTNSLWDILTSNGTTATSSAGVLTVNSGTTSAGFAEMLSKETFTIPMRVMMGVQVPTRFANTMHFIEIVSVDPSTGEPDEKNRVGWSIGGSVSTTATIARYEVQNGGVRPLVSANTTILTTANYTVLEIEPFADEAWFHQRTLDSSTTGRSLSVVRHQQIPDSNAVYKIRIRSMNMGDWAATTISNATDNGGLVQITTSAAHGLSNGAVVWIDSLGGVTSNGNVVRGFFTIGNASGSVFTLNGSVFGGTYQAGSGRYAVAAAPATTAQLQFQFIHCQDYAELTAEITAGRGSNNAAQATSVILAGATAANTAIGTVAVSSITAGTAAIGDVGQQYRATATGAASGTHVVSAATTNATIVKAAAGRVVGWSFGNTTASWRYVKLHNIATLPTAGSGVVRTIAIPPNAVSNNNFEGGIAFTTGIGLTIVTGSADNDTNAVGAGDVVGELFWA